MMFIEPKVAINGTTLNFVISNPLNPLTRNPIINVARMARGHDTLKFTMRMAATQPVSAIMDPTDKSIPRVIMISVIPVAIIPTTETDENIFMKFLTERKYWDANEK